MTGIDINPEIPPEGEDAFTFVPRVTPQGTTIELRLSFLHSSRRFCGFSVSWTPAPSASGRS